MPIPYPEHRRFDCFRRGIYGRAINFCSRAVDFDLCSRQKSIVFQTRSAYCRNSGKKIHEAVRGRRIEGVKREREIVSAFLRLQGHRGLLDRFNRLAEMLRGKAHMFTKHGREVTGRLKTAGQGDFSDGSFRFFQHFAAFLNPVLDQVIVGRLAEMFFEQ